MHNFKFLTKKDSEEVKLLLILGLQTLALSIVCAVTVLFLGKFLPSKLPLFYSLPWGERQLATQTQLLIIPAISACITLVNLTLFWQLHSSQFLFKRILIFSSLICSLVLLISLIKMIFIFI